MILLLIDDGEHKNHNKIDPIIVIDIVRLVFVLEFIQNCLILVPSMASLYFSSEYLQ